ncbi:MAG TPA: MFS transporter [Parachlamydiaceae bacterium]|nr:MFS transporter [Parachlamydiaceae bacterium]
MDTSTFQRTRLAFICTRLLNTPFWALFVMLKFILCKDLHATEFQVTTFIVLAPLVSILSVYWSSSMNRRRDKLLSNVILANVLKHLPFFLFPFVQDVWFFVFAAAFFMLFHRSSTPAWMEILKLNLPKHAREQVFANGTAIAFLGDGFFCFLLGFLLDHYQESWRLLFPMTALISSLSLYFQIRIPILPKEDEEELKEIPFKEHLLAPWKNAWQICKERRDFTQFQIGFMILGGGGLMIMQPALPTFFMETLNLSYMELSIVLTFCKGIGCALTSSFFARWINKVDIYVFGSSVTLIGFLFCFLLIAAKLHLVWLYAAYAVYGAMQAGSELGWNMSGPIFSKEQESSLYTNSNVLLVGLRGIFFPVVGGVLVVAFNPSLVIFFGGILCLLATFKLQGDKKLALAQII